MKKPKLTDASVKGGTPAGKKSVQSAASVGFPALAGIALLLLLGLGIYSNSFDCSFHLDDKNSIMENTNIHDLSRLDDIWNFNHNRFIPYLSLAVNYHFGQLQVWGYHAFNLVVHLINALLVYWLTLLVFSTPALKEHKLARHKQALALVTAMLFVSHPLATQSVTYIVQRLASMVALFYFLSMALYLKGRLSSGPGASRYMYFAGALAAGIMALFSKENAYTLPLNLLLIEALLLQKVVLHIRWNDYRVWLTLGSLLALALFIYLRFTAVIFQPILPTGGNAYTVTSTNYLFTQFSVILTYIRLLFFPYKQNLDYDYPLSESLLEPVTLLSLLALLGILALGVYLLQRSRLVAFGIFFFFIALAVESSIVPIADIIFEHRTYLPSFGFFLILSSVGFSLFGDQQRNMVYLLFTFIIGVNAVLTYQRNKVWKDELSLWNDVVSKSPGKARAYLNRGVAHWTAGNRQQALADYRQATALDPEHYYSAYYNLGVAESGFGQWDNAIRSYSRAIALYPQYPAAYAGLGIAYASNNMQAEALQAFAKAIELNPNDAQHHFNRGNVYMTSRQWTPALEDYSRAVSLNPAYVDAFSNRAIVYGNLGEYQNAINDCSKVIELDPAYVKAYTNRAITYYSMGKWSEAIADYSTVLKMAPGNISAYYNRGLAYMNTQNWEAAVADLSKVLEADPSNQSAINSRAQAMANLQKQ